MNKKQWLASSEPQVMLAHLKDCASDRKLRLFAVACCRHFWPRFEESAVSRQAVEWAERFADGLTTVKECALARASLGVAWGSPFDPVSRAVRGMAAGAVKSKAGGGAIDTGHEAALLAGRAARLGVPGGKSSAAAAAERQAITLERQRQVASIREVFGNPFRPVAVEASWLTSDVLALAHGIYAEKALDRCPILADALQDAGCANEDLLNHLRHGADHVRGCWALDLILGKQ